MYLMSWDRESCRLMQLTWKITVTKLYLSENATGSLKIQLYRLFSSILIKNWETFLKSVFKWPLLLQHKEKSWSYLPSNLFGNSIFQNARTDIEVLGKGSFLLNILQPLITYSWKLRFEYFVERLVQPTAAQFRIFIITT